MGEKVVTENEGILGSSTVDSFHQMDGVELPSSDEQDGPNGPSIASSPTSKNLYEVVKDLVRQKKSVQKKIYRHKRPSLTPLTTAFLLIDEDEETEDGIIVQDKEIKTEFPSYLIAPCILILQNYFSYLKVLITVSFTF